MIRASTCIVCETPLTGRQRLFCGRRCSTRHHVQVFRGAKLRFEIHDLDGGDAALLGIVKLANVLHRLAD